MRFAFAFVLVGALPWGAGAAPPVGAPPASNPECRGLPGIIAPLAFSSGETLEFELDALGIAQAGTMTMKVLPLKDGKIPIEVNTHTNTLFSKIRRVKAIATSYLDAKSLRPARYVED